MSDIVDRITKVAPSELDKFEIDIARRVDLPDDKFNKVLRDTFLSLDKGRLPPATSWAWNQISKRLQSQ
jgi:hypothetical protein